MSSSTAPPSKTVGEFSHTLIDSFEHRVTSKAIAYAGEGVPDMLRPRRSRGYSIPSLEHSPCHCELSWDVPNRYQ